MLASSEIYFKDVIKEYIHEFVHLAAFWKIVDDMSKYDNYVNLIQYKLETCNFIDDAVNTISQYIDMPIDTNTLIPLLLKIVVINNEQQSECICEPMFGFNCRMANIIHELLNTITLATDPTDPTWQEDICDFESINNTLQMLKQINMDIIVQELIGFD